LGRNSILRGKLLPRKTACKPTAGLPSSSLHAFVEGETTSVAREGEAADQRREKGEKKAPRCFGFEL
jgi:hypothetical protein